jgi:hypothetical protein
MAAAILGLHRPPYSIATMGVVCGLALAFATTGCEPDRVTDVAPWAPITVTGRVMWADGTGVPCTVAAFPMGSEPVATTCGGGGHYTITWAENCPEGGFVNGPYIEPHVPCYANSRTSGSARCQPRMQVVNVTLDRCPAP